MSVSPSPSHATDAASISLDFEKRAIPIDTPQAIDNFIGGSRQTLNHLKLAALSQILEARSRNKNITDRENLLHSAEIYGIGKVVKEASRKTMGLSRFSATMLPLFEIWLDRALHINSALLRQQFDAADPFRIVQA